MEIRYRVTGDSRNVSDEIGRTLIARGLAESVAAVAEPEVDSEPPTEAKPRTKTQRGRYKRRDLRAEK